MSELRVMAHLRSGRQIPLTVPAEALTRVVETLTTGDDEHGWFMDATGNTIRFAAVDALEPIDADALEALRATIPQVPA